MKKFLLFSILVIFSCSKENSVENFDTLTEENFLQHLVDVKVNFDQNEEFIAEFLEKSNSNQLDQNTVLKMLDIYRYIS
jgi:hypothetical protein